MKQKTGYNEAVNMAVFITVPQLIFSYISYGLSDINSGYWLNFTICSLAAFLLIIPIKNSFAKTLNVYTRTNVLERVISILICIYVFLITLYNLKISTKALDDLTSSSFDLDIIVFLPVVSAVICSGLGVEAISRTAYFLVYICIGILLLICAVSFKGFDVENIYPILGNSKKTTFLNFSSLGVYVPLFAVYILRDNINEPKRSFGILKKALVCTYITGLVLIVLCMLAIPYPMIKFYGFSLSAIFSIAQSSVFFHRFEILLILFVMIVTTVSVSIGLNLFSKKLSDLTKSHDYKPFSLIGGGLLFYLCTLIDNNTLLWHTCVILSILLYICFTVKAFIIYLKQKSKRDIS